MAHKIRNDFAQKILGRMNGQAVVEIGCYNRGTLTVTEIVEQDPGAVSEVWCRKIFRQLLQSLERQYALQLPHRTITPDTVVVRDDGEPMVLPTQSDPRPEVAKDLTDLARVIHYAITRERASTRPLRGRALEGYSDSIITAVDRSMARDPATRPHTIDELRVILGIVALKEVLPARTTAKHVPVRSSQLHASRPLHPPESASLPARPPLWQLVGGSAAILLGVVLAILGGSRESSFFDGVGPRRPQTSDVARVRTHAKLPAAAISVPALASPDASPARTPPLAPHDAAIGMDASTNSTQEIARVSKTPAQGMGVAGVKKNSAKLPQHASTDGNSLNPPKQNAILSEPAQLVQRPTLPASRAAAGNAVLDLQIQPWGVVYVDGIERGVSPPMKRLTVSPGRHSILVKNPTSDARGLEIDTTRGERHIAVDFTDEPE